MMAVFLWMKRAEDIDQLNEEVLPFIGIWSYCPPAKIVFFGKTTNFVPCKCKKKGERPVCEHSPVFPRVTTVKGEA